MQIGTRSVPLIIAEVGVNHNGSSKLGRELIAAAAMAGADAVKFQTFRSDRLASPSTPKVPYQERDTSSLTHLSMLQKVELSRTQHFELADYCSQVGLEFMSTPYSSEDVELLQEIGVRRYKVASADIVDIPLHVTIAQTRLPVLISTGMATLDEIAEVVAVYKHADVDVTLLHTVSKYPTPIEEANIQRMRTLADDFNVKVGYSDHTEGVAAAAAAAALGAVVIEKHFTLDRHADGPDHLASADPDTFRDMVRLIRQVSAAQGTGSFALQEGEADMARTSRKSLHIGRAVDSGRALVEADLILRRPGTGIMWANRYLVIGRVAGRDLKVGEILTIEDLE